MALNEVINRIDEGHVASFKAEQRLDPHQCKKCQVLWPCPVIAYAREVVRRLHGVKKVA